MQDIYSKDNMFKNITIKNFQSCKDVTLEDLGPINMLYGYNNSGKSSILKAINFPVEPYITNSNFNWEIENQYHQYMPNYSETVFGKDDSNSIRILYECIPPKELKELLLEIIETGMRQGIPVDFSTLFVGFQVHRNNVVGESILDSNLNMIYMKRISENGRYTIDTIKESKASAGGSLNTVNWQFSSSGLGNSLQELRNYVFSVFKGLYFFSVDRKPKDWKTPPRKWPRIGIHGENVVSLLNYLRNEEEALYNLICEEISKISPDVTGTSSPMNVDGNVSIAHDVHNSKISVNALMSGTGINQTIPIIVQLMYANPGETILIEEPEISLYPEAQDVLTDIMIKETKKDKQIIFTTHSDTIPFALLRSLGTYELPDDFVKCYEIRKEDGETKVAPRTLNDSLGILYSPKGWRPT